MVPSSSKEALQVQNTCEELTDASCVRRHQDYARGRCSHEATLVAAASALDPPASLKTCQHCRVCQSHVCKSKMIVTRDAPCDQWDAVDKAIHKVRIRTFGINQSEMRMIAFGGNKWRGADAPRAAHLFVSSSSEPDHFQRAGLFSAESSTFTTFALVSTITSFFAHSCIFRTRVQTSSQKSIDFNYTKITSRDRTLLIKAIQILQFPTDSFILSRNGSKRSNTREV
jgi:hypothetical protein